MLIKINYTKNINKNQISNYALLLNNFNNLNELKSLFTKSEINSIKEILKNLNLNKNIINFNLDSKKNFFLIKTKENLNTYEFENLGAEFYEYIKNLSLKSLFINPLSINKDKES